MSETIIGGNRWDSLSRKADLARISCQSSCEIDEIDIANYNEYLLEKKKNPTVAKIAIVESMIKSNTETYLTGYNRSMLERVPENETLVKSIYEKELKSYPNTGRLRNVLIQEGRFSLNSVTPKITNKLKKIIIKIKSFI